MHISVLRQILYIFFLHQLSIVLSLTSLSYGTNITRWSEDDWLETKYLLNSKFMFNRQRYEYVSVHTRMNQWSLELSYGNKSNLNGLWTEFHIFLDRRNPSASLNNSLYGHVRPICRPPITSPLSNDSNTSIRELSDIDKLIADYFISDGFFRTINYLHCTIDEKRRDPTMHIEMDIYLVTNREFRSLLYIEMSSTTRDFFFEHKARFYLRNNEQKFKYNFNISNISSSTNSRTSLVYMLKLYNQNDNKRSNSNVIFLNVITVFISCFLFGVYF